ncbi:MAG: pyridine nucleotide-disulfide oxidoreductase [Desulfobacterium sp.]|nr:pyridine nucleotide-disulfide oxidoreductase [Desulfobacterium sp.]MBU4035627.1 FAD-dependent oxidoreductase [Pseudomonadota bacterium]
MPKIKLRVLVVGGVACGPKAASRLKRLLPDADITIIEKGGIISYGACGLPYYVEGLFPRVEMLTETPVGVARTPAFFEKAKGVKVLTGTEALSIDRKAKTVTVKDLATGKTDKMEYDKLVLATGGFPFSPPIPGVNLKNVWFIRQPGDADTIVKEIEAQNLKRAVLIGAGFISLEMSEALVKKGLDVTMVEKEDQIMPALLDKDVAMFAAKHLRQKGVKLILSERVKAIGGEGIVSSVDTDKQSIPADLVIIAVGTRPNDGLARDAGIQCMDKGGIVVNEYCKTSDEHIYAGGDCVVSHYVNKTAGSPLYVPLGSTANKHGRVIANHIAGNPTPFNGIACSSIVKAFDYTIGRTGFSEKQARALNLDIETTTWAGADKPHFMPDSKPFIIKMIAGKRDRKLIGIQVAGMGDGAKRLDVAAGAILFGATLDQLADVDFAYAPPYGPALDPLATCDHLLINKMDGIAAGISAFEAKKRIETGDVILLDVRTPEEVAAMPFPYDFVNIPLGALRQKAESLPKDKDIITFCKISLRGYEAQRILNAAGFNRVSYIEGGILGWPF